MASYLVVGNHVKAHFNQIIKSKIQMNRMNLVCYKYRLDLFARSFGQVRIDEIRRQQIGDFISLLGSPEQGYGCLRFQNGNDLDMRRLRKHVEWPQAFQRKSLIQQAPNIPRLRCRIA